MLTACAVGMGLFVTAVVIAEFHRKTEHTPLAVWVFKPLASTGFLAAALAVHALDHTFGKRIFIALSLCFIGDILLIPRTAKAFAVGFGAFLCAHAAFAAAFLQKNLALSGIGLGGGLMLAVSIFTCIRLWPYARGKMKALLVCYMIAITVMVGLASGVWAGAGDHTIMAAAALFAFSDFFIAKDRFVRTEFLNRAIALPVYYLSQLLFAMSAGI